MRTAYIGIVETEDNNRQYFSELTKEAYHLLGIEVIFANGLSNARRYWIEGDVMTPAQYIIADDDCIPGDTQMFENAFRLMQENPQVGMVGFNPSSIPDSYVIGAFMPDARAHYHGHAIGVREVGGIRVVRAGIVKETEMKPGREDESFCNQFLEKGYKIVALAHRFHHLGEGFSTHV